MCGCVICVAFCANCQDGYHATAPSAAACVSDVVQRQGGILILIRSLAPLFRCSVCCDCAHYAESSEAIQHQLIKLNEKLSETSEHNLKLAALVLKRLPDQAALLQTQVGVVERRVVRSDRTGTGTLWDW